MRFDDGESILEEFLSRQKLAGERPSIAEGTLIGEWLAGGFIARGGTSEVYCAKNAKTGESAALKILYRTEDRHKIRFAREAEFLAKNASDAFPRFFASGVWEGRLYMAMELLEPMELPKGDRAVAKYVSKVAKGLEWLHIHGYVHRDVKPRNIMRRGANEPVIIDFGLIKEISSSPIGKDDPLSIVDGHAAGVGTPKYAAPEQFEGGDATPATDIHALGRLAYECFGANPPRCWSKIIRRATSSIQGERYQTAEDFMRAVKTRHAARFAALGGAAAAATGLALALHAAFTEPEFPEEWNLDEERIVLDTPAVLKGGKTYRIIGPGAIKGDFTADEEATLWLTNCVVNNTTRSTYPENKLKYVLAGEAYLNFTKLEKPQSGVGEFIWTPDGADNDLDTCERTGADNDIRFKGPDTYSDLLGQKNMEFNDRRRNADRSPR